eukprot:4812166-Alexandrium_andersonii.AAC.1
MSQCHYCVARAWVATGSPVSLCVAYSRGPHSKRSGPAPPGRASEVRAVERGWFCLHGPELDEQQSQRQQGQS